MWEKEKILSEVLLMWKHSRFYFLPQNKLEKNKDIWNLLAINQLSRNYQEGQGSDDDKPHPYLDKAKISSKLLLITKGKIGID